MPNGRRQQNGRGKKRRRDENDGIDLPGGKKHRRLCDSSQSQQERRNLRVQYRKLQERTTDARPEIVDVATNKFSEYCRQQDGLFGQVSYPSEAYLDIQQSKTIAGFLVEQTQDLANAQFTFSASDIVSAIKTKFHADGGGIDWVKIGESAAPFFRTVPAVRMMNGKMQKDVVEAPVKAKRQYKKKVEKDVGPVTQPSVVSAKDIRSQDKTETKTRIQRLRKTMRDKDNDPETRENNIFELLVNPVSYSETVENFFDMSFLCRQGFTQLEVDEESKQPIVTYVSTEENKMRRKQESALSNSQCIIRLDPTMFSDVVSTYKISDSQIQREISLSVHPDSDDDDKELDVMLGHESSTVNAGRSARTQSQRKSTQSRRQSARTTPGSQRRRVASGKRQLESDTEESESESE